MGNKLLRSLQKTIIDSGRVYSEISKKLDIPPQRMSEFMNADEIRGLKRTEQMIKEFRPDIWKIL